MLAISPFPSQIPSEPRTSLARAQLTLKHWLALLQDNEGPREVSEAGFPCILQNCPKRSNEERTKFLGSKKREGRIFRVSRNDLQQYQQNKTEFTHPPFFNMVRGQAAMQYWGAAKCHSKDLSYFISSQPEVRNIFTQSTVIYAATAT